MTDLRTAAQQALEALLTYEQYIQPLTDVFGGPRVPEAGSASAKVYAAITALRAALAEPVQEPAAWTNMPDADDWVFISGSADPNQRLAGKWHPLYTAPPQRKPLTPDKTMELANETAGHHWCDEAHLQRFRAAIEKAHGIE